VLEPELRLTCGSKFSLTTASRGESSRTTLAFEFEAKDCESTLTTRLVKACYTNSYTVDFNAKSITTADGYWMRTLGASAHALQAHQEELLCEAPEQTLHAWFDAAPATWLREGRAILLHPSQSERPPVALCERAKQKLAEGRTLLVMKGELASVRMPGHTMHVAGLGFRETRDDTASADPTAEEGRTTREGRPAMPMSSWHACFGLPFDASATAASSAGCEQAPSKTAPLRLETVVIAERAQRRCGWKFDGRSPASIAAALDTPALELLDTESASYFTADGVFDWQAHDEYAYEPDTDVDLAALSMVQHEPPRFSGYRRPSGSQLRRGHAPQWRTDSVIPA